MARDVTLDLIGRDRTKAATASAASNFDRLNKRLDQANKKSKSFGDRFKVVGDKVQRGADLMIAGLIGIGTGSIKMAANAEQSIGSVETVFGKYAKTVIKQSERASKAVGLSADEYRNAATLIGSQLKNQGVAQAKLGKETDKLIKLGADFSSMFGGTAAEAVDALSSALKGEFDPIEKYGVSLKQSTINVEAYRLAHVKTQSAFSKLSVAQQAAAKRQATLNLIFAQGKDSVGNFGREANTASHKAQVLAARAKDLGVKLGNDLLPLALDAADAAAKLAKWLEKDDKNIRLLSEGVGLAGLSIKAFKLGPLVGGLVTIGSALELLSIKYQGFNDAIVGVNLANKEDLQSLVVFWLGAVDKILTAWATINPLVRGVQKSVHKSFLDAQADLKATQDKWAASEQAIKNRPIIAKITATIADLDAKIAAAKAKLKTVHGKKARAKIEATIKDLEAKAAAAKHQLARVQGTRTVAKIKAEIRDLDAKTKAAQAKLKTVHNAKTQAKIRAEINDLQAKAAAARRELASIHGKTVTITATYKKVIQTINKGSINSGNNKTMSAGDGGWAGAAGGSYRTGGARVVLGDTNVDSRVFIDGRELRAMARSTVVDENRRAAHRARVGRR